MTRILHAMAGAEFGGAEAFFVRLVRALKNSGESECVVMRENADRARALRDAGVNPIETRFGRWFDFATPRALTDAFDEFDPEIVMSWMSRAARACGRLRGDRRFIHLGRMGGYYDLKYYRGCDHLVGNTPDIVDYLVREGWPASRAHFVPNFVDGAPAAPVDRKVLDTPPEAPVLLVLGRLHPNKGIDIAIRALADVPHAYLWIAGDGPSRGKLRSLARDTRTAGRIRFLGWRADVAALLAAADILVCPSRHEPLGNVIIEAWAHATAVVAARSAGPAWLIDDGETGVLVPVDDVAALTAATRDLLDDDARRHALADHGRRKFEARFTEQAVVANYRALFARLFR